MNKAFTFLEVLITLTIVAILSTLTIWGIYHYTKYAHRVKCASNMRQIYQYLLMYLEDHNDIYPNVKGLDENAPDKKFFFQLLIEKGYIEGDSNVAPSFFRCPEDPRPKSEIAKTGSYDLRTGTIHGYDYQDPRANTFSRIQNKSNRIIMGDLEAGWHVPGSDRFKRKINVLYADGHVEMVTEVEWQENIREPLWE